MYVVLCYFPEWLCGSLLACSGSGCERYDSTNSCHCACTSIRLTLTMAAVLLITDNQQLPKTIFRLQANEQQGTAEHALGRGFRRLTRL